MEGKGLALLSASALCTLSLISYPLSSCANTPSLLSMIVGNNDHFAPESHFKTKKLKNVVDLAPAQGDLKSAQMIVGKTIYRPRASLGPFYQTDVDAFGLYDLFVPYTLDSHTIMFVDGRYYQRSNSTWEYNAGLGVRNITPNGEYLWSLYGFYDDRRTRFANNFSQITVGADFQSKRWYFNTNGYFPVGRRKAFVPQFNTAYLCTNNTRICYARGEEKSMGGWDAEFGYTLWRNFRAYAGMYVFAANRVKTAVGPNFRLQYDIRRLNPNLRVFFDKIALIANYRYDKLAGSNWYAGARFDITLGKLPPNVGLERRMTSFIRRDLNVEMSSDGSGDTANLTEPTRILTNDFDGQQTQVALVNAGTTDADFNAVITNARNNIVGVRGGQIITTDKAMQANQVLEGGVFSFMREGQPFAVQVGQNGLISRGAPLISLVRLDGANPTVENMAFNNAGATAGTYTIVSFGAANTTIIVRNNTQNSLGNFLSVNPVAAAGTVTVIVQNNRLIGAGVTGASPIIRINGANAPSTINTILDNNVITTTVDVTGLAVISSGAANEGSLNNAWIRNNIITTAANIATGNSAVQILGGGVGGSIALRAFSGNTITSTGDTGMLIQFANKVTGSITNNSITAAAIATTGAFVVQSLAFNVPWSTLFSASITNNTFTNTTALAAAPAVHLSSNGNPAADISIVLAGGFTNNTLTSGIGTGIKIDSNAGGGTFDLVAIDGFNSNTFTSFGVGAAVSINNDGSLNVSLNLGVPAAGATPEDQIAAANGLVGADVTITVPITVTQ